MQDDVYAADLTPADLVWNITRQATRVALSTPVMRELVTGQEREAIADAAADAAAARFKALRGIE